MALTVIILATLLLTLFVSAFVIRRFDRAHARQRVHCPVHQRAFDVDVQIRPRPWRFGDERDVTKCSYFSPSCAITCQKACLRQIEDEVRNT